MISYNVKIEIFDIPEEAPNYNIDGNFKSAIMEKCIIVKNGTVNGNPSVDIQIKDKNGNNYVIMTTRAIIEGIAAALKGSKEQKRKCIICGKQATKFTREVIEKELTDGYKNFKPGLIIGYCDKHSDNKEN